MDKISFPVKITWGECLDPEGDKPTLVQIMAWCHLVTSHYLIQRWSYEYRANISCSTRATLNAEIPLGRLDQYITSNSKHIGVSAPHPSMPVSTPTHKFPHPLTMCNEASMNIEIIGMSTPHPPNLRWVPPTLVGVTPPPKKKKRKYLLYLGNIPVKFQKDWNKTSSVIVWTNPSDYRPAYVIRQNFKNSSKIQILQFG